MAKTYLSHAKYVIRQKFEIRGVVDKHDIIGAIFGQSEGIIGEDLDLRELQANGKIGRIEIETESHRGITKGTLTIPSGSDMVETSILAATIEIVDKVGPCDAKFNTVKIEDTRIFKRKNIVNNAKRLLTKLIQDEIPDSQEIANEVRAEVRTSEIVSYGVDKLPAGPIIDESEEVIIVEGRADVINLLKYNFKNVIAMGGSKIPRTIVDLSKRKEVTAFIDGDRGGELDLKRLLQIAQIDYVTKAPPGREVEELTKKEILFALSKRVPTAQDEDPKVVDKVPNPKIDEIDVVFKEEKREEPRTSSYTSRNTRAPRDTTRYSSRTSARSTSRSPARTSSRTYTKPKAELPADLKVDVSTVMSEISGKLEAKFFDAKGKEIDSHPVRDLVKVLKDKTKANAIVFDGIITKRLAELAKKQGVEYLVGAKKGKMSKIKGIEIIEYSA